MLGKSQVVDSAMLDSPVYRKTGKMGFRDVLQANLTFYNFDTYLALLPYWTGGFGKMIDLVIDGTLAWIATVIGYKATYPEYVTEELCQTVKKGQKGL